MLERPSAISPFDKLSLRLFILPSDESVQEEGRWPKGEPAEGLPLPGGLRYSAPGRKPEHAYQ